MNRIESDRNALQDGEDQRCSHCGQQIGAEQRLKYVGTLLKWALVLAAVALVLSRLS